MLGISHIQVQVVMHSGITHNSLHKLMMQYQISRRHTLTVLVFLFSINHLHTCHLDQMHFAHLI